jgi:DNA-binding transcriptional regulator YbjK
MRPVNTERRAALADAAIGVLAEAGIRGLTHRAVDAAAGEPDGTTSRYFRTREAMLLGVVDRVKEIRMKMLDDLVSDGLDRAELVEAFVVAVHNALHRDRPKQLAMMALLLESSHRPALREELTLVALSMRQMLVKLCARAGVELTERDAWALMNFFNGTLFLAMSLPQLEQPTEEIVRAGVSALLTPYDGSARPM